MFDIKQFYSAQQLLRLIFLLITLSIASQQPVDPPARQR
jgi:hypothetical protein